VAVAAGLASIVVAHSGMLSRIPQFRMLAVLLLAVQVFEFKQVVLICRIGIELASIDSVASEYVAKDHCRGGAS
jgi:hypothetical protein